jgi:hypothetical protein
MTTSPLDTLTVATENLEPGDVVPGQFLQRPTVEVGDDPGIPGTIVSDLESAGYTRVWDTLTWEESLVSNNALPTQLKVMRADGVTPILTKVKAGEAFRGTFKCFLHPDQPEHEMFVAMGFAPCSKRTMPNSFQANNHNKNRHHEEWLAYQSIITDQRRQEEDADRKALTAALLARSVAPVVADKKERTPEKVEADQARMAAVRGKIGTKKESSD